MRFTGYMRLRIREAADLKPTTFSTRHNFHKKIQQMDPYIVIKVDNFKLGQTAIRPKTCQPAFNEEFCPYICEGKVLELAVFHDTPIGYDDFVANCTMQLENLLTSSSGRQTFDGWVRNSSYSHVLHTHTIAVCVLLNAHGPNVNAHDISMPNKLLDKYLPA